MAKTKNEPTHYFWTQQHLEAIRENPHILSWIVGKEKHTEIHSHWIKYIWTSKKSVALNAHRGSYKSTAISCIGSVWYLLFNPEARIFIVRKTFADAVDSVNTIAKIMEQKEVRELFFFAHGEYPDFRVRREGKVEFTFKHNSTPEPSVMAFGLNSPFTGRHADFILCDDISTLKDRLSKAEREFTKQIWRELSTNIIDRGKPCCYIGTPWHKDGVESIIPKPLQFSIHECNLMSEAEVEYARSQTTPALFAANYELKFAADDDALFKDPVYGEWPLENMETPYAQVDAAYGGDDLCAFSMASRHKKTGKIYVKGWTYKGTIVDFIPFIAEKMRLHKCRKIAVELNPDKGYTATLLRAEGLSVHEYTEGVNKQHKIATYLYEAWPNMIFSPECDDTYMGQIVDWTALSKEHDDSPDSLASLCRFKFSSKSAKNERWLL